MTAAQWLLLEPLRQCTFVSHEYTNGRTSDRPCVFGNFSAVLSCLSYALHAFLTSECSVSICAAVRHPPAHTSRQSCVASPCSSPSDELRKLHTRAPAADSYATTHSAQPRTSGASHRCTRGRQLSLGVPGDDRKGRPAQVQERVVRSHARRQKREGCVHQFGCKCWKSAAAKARPSSALPKKPCACHVMWPSMHRTFVAA